MKSWRRRLWTLFLHYRRFVRWAALSFSLILPLLGAGTVVPDLSFGQIVGLVGVAWASHLFGYVLNDVVDLPVDRLHPSRGQDLLVQGRVRPWQALTFALLHIPLAFLINFWLQGSGKATALLAASFSAGAIYNLWGKRFIYPMLTDTIQGLAWSGLVLYGAAIANQPLTALTWQLFVFVTLYIVLVNGVHASLRDLVSDRQAGMRTTAIWLGAEVKAPNRLIIPARLLGYVAVLQAILTLLLLWPLFTNALGYQPLTWALTFASVVGLQALCSGCTVWLIHPQRRGTIVVPVMAYIVLSLLSLLLLYAPYLAPKLRIALLLAYLFPLGTDMVLALTKLIPTTKS